MTLEPDGGTGRRKPPRKERKKLITASSSILFYFETPKSILNPYLVLIQMALLQHYRYF